MNPQSASPSRAARLHGMAALKVGIAAAVIVLASPAHANLIGQQVLGSLKFQGGGPNYFDPANGLVPAGFGNSAGPLVTVAPFGNSFGFTDDHSPGLLVRDNSNLTQHTSTDSYLDIGTDSDNDTGMYPWEQTFTSLTPGAFNTLTLVSSTYSGLTYSLVGDTITLDWVGIPVGPPVSFVARFTVRHDDIGPPPPPPPGVPEPASWALMILGFGGVGAMLRSRRRSLAV